LRAPDQSVWLSATAGRQDLLLAESSALSLAQLACAPIHAHQSVQGTLPAVPICL
jgi:hypothetical protein